MIVASAATAQDGLYLTVGDCAAGSSVRQIEADCTTDAGLYGTLVASVILPHSIPRYVAVGTDILMQASTATLPDWWRVDQNGPCVSRIGAVTATQDGTAAASCASVWDGQGTILSLFVASYGSMPMAPGVPNRIRFSTVAAILAPASLVADGSELAVAKLSIAMAGTTGCSGGGAVNGCTTHVTFRLEQINFTSDVLGSPIDRVTNPGSVGSDIVEGQAHPDPTPTRNRTWGAIKALYR